MQDGGARRWWIAVMSDRWCVVDLAKERHLAGSTRFGNCDRIAQLGGRIENESPPRGKGSLIPGYGARSGGPRRRRCGIRGSGVDVARPTAAGRRRSNPSQALRVHRSAFGLRVGAQRARISRGRVLDP